MAVTSTPSSASSSSSSPAPAPAPLRERLRWNAELGALHDGPRRYLMMRPDVLMGALAGLPLEVRAQVFEALARATREHGSDSLHAYAAQVGGAGAEALMAATAQAAADLGWGRWSLHREGEALHLSVVGSPFAAGWPRGGAAAKPAEAAQSEQPAPAGPVAPAAQEDAAQPVCAPIRGMLEALAGMVLGARAAAAESECTACGAASCRFVAQRASSGLDESMSAETKAPAP